MKRLKKILISLDQLLGQLMFRDIGPDETISAYCWRRGYARRVAVIDWIFLKLLKQKYHCKQSYMSEKLGLHLNEEYRQCQKKTRQPTA